MREMKDSGVPWIGEIPKWWNLMKGRYCYDILSGFPFASDRFSNSSGYPLIRIRDITSGTIETFFNGDYPVEYVIKSGDLLVGMDGDFNIRLWANVNALLNQRCCKITEKNGYDRRWLYYVLPFNLAMINSLAYSTTVKHLSVPDLKEADIPSPSLSEQRRIADFLDTKCAEIDSVLEKTKASIEEYRKLKQSVITEAVTKGVRGKRPMKDSGVEWIGDIPLEWKVSSLKRILLGIQDGTHATLPRVDVGFPLLSAKNVQGGKIVLGDNESCISAEDYHAIISNGYPQKGDILFCCIGGSIGKCCMYEFDYSMAFQRSVTFVRVNEKGYNRYVYYLFLSDIFVPQYELFSNVSAQAGIYMGALREFTITIPDLSEQKEIAAYLDEKCAAIDSLISSKEALVAELETYKKSLIYEYVTGKKEVPAV